MRSLKILNMRGTSEQPQDPVPGHSSALRPELTAAISYTLAHALLGFYHQCPSETDILCLGHEAHIVELLWLWGLDREWHRQSLSQLGMSTLLTSSILALMTPHLTPLHIHTSPPKLHCVEGRYEDDGPGSGFSWFVVLSCYCLSGVVGDLALC